MKFYLESLRNQRTRAFPQSPRSKKLDFLAVSNVLLGPKPKLIRKRPQKKEKLRKKAQVLVIPNPRILHLRAKLKVVISTLKAIIQGKLRKIPINCPRKSLSIILLKPQSPIEKVQQKIRFQRKLQILRTKKSIQTFSKPQI